MSDSDNQDFTDGEEGLEATGTPKKSGSGFLPSLLKWIAIGLGSLLVIVTICIITVNALKNSDHLVMAYYHTYALPKSAEYANKFENLSYYDAIDAFNVNSNDKPPRTIRVNLVFGYTKDDKTVSADITNHQYEIRDWLRRYFRFKTAADLGPEKEGDIQLEIRNGINDDILSNTKIKSVKIMQLDVIEN